MEQAKLKAPSSWSKTGVKRENFSPTEKRIAKLGLWIAPAVFVLYHLHNLFPDTQQFAVVFAHVGAVFLLLAFTCVAHKPTETAVGGVKKAAEFGLRFIKGRSIQGKFAFACAKTSIRHGRIACRTHTRNRAYRSHHSRSLSTNPPRGSSDSSGSSGDSSDPPEPPPLPHRVRKSHNLLSPWRCLRIPGPWRLACRRARRWA